MAMIVCTACRRHRRDSDPLCPFCAEKSAAGSRTSTGRRALHLLGGAMTTVVLAACYGTGGFDDEWTDMDGDGFGSDEDCNDNDAAVNPGATELCDNLVDDDCNDLVDLADPVCSDTDI
jgi:hypothetical protein